MEMIDGMRAVIAQQQQLLDSRADEQDEEPMIFAKKKMGVQRSAAPPPALPPYKNESLQKEIAVLEAKVAELEALQEENVELKRQMGVKIDGMQDEISGLQAQLQRTAADAMGDIKIVDGLQDQLRQVEAEAQLQSNDNKGLRDEMKKLKEHHVVEEFTLCDKLEKLEKEKNVLKRKPWPQLCKKLTVVRRAKTRQLRRKQLRRKKTANLKRRRRQKR